MGEVASALVAFDATPLEVSHRTGVSQAVAELLGALVDRQDGYRYAAMASRRLNGRLPHDRIMQVGARFPNRSLWMQLVVPAILTRLRPDLSHFTNSIAPLVGSRPFVVTFYDMSLFLHPDTQPPASVVAVRTLMPALARRASAIVTPTESARQDVVRVLGVPGHRVHVVPAAAAARFHQEATAEDFERAARRYGLQPPFVLAVATVEPRKNLARLVEAIVELRRAGRRERLVIAGRLGWKYEKTLERIEAAGRGDVVQRIGYVADEDMPALYRLARVVAFPSLYEGFGMPILEGMACGVPVVTSDRSATAEVAADAALLVDPLSVDAIAAGMRRVLEDEALREALIAAGRRRARSFSWPNAAAEMVRVYDEVRKRN